MKISPNALTINQLFGSANEQYVIPTYQRRYSWQKKQIWELIEDIQLLESGDTHLLGSIVCLTTHLKAGLNSLELVDGQQRLTTLSILMECLRERLVSEGLTENSADLGRLLTARTLQGEARRKIALDSIDSAEFDRLVQKEYSDSVENEHLRRAFQIIREWVEALSIDEVNAFTYRLTNQATVIRLDVSEAKDAFKLFETINNRGLRLSPTDIVKNFLLGNAARFDNTNALPRAREAWTALVKNLDGTNSDAFFRYYLMTVLHVPIKTWEVVSHFKGVFMSSVQEAKLLPDRHLYIDVRAEDDDDEEVDTQQELDTSEALSVSGTDTVPFNLFLARLVKSAEVYSQLVLARTGVKTVDRRLRNLKMIKAVQTYGFLTHLRVGGCSDKNFLAVLKLTESFVLRRHVCRERSNETEALFARMCDIDAMDPLSGVREAYRGLSPSDEKFQEEFANAGFTATVMERARYCLERFEEHAHGTHDEITVNGPDEVHVEHIIPQKIKTKKKVKEPFEDWLTYLGDKAEASHPKYVSRIGNLTLFSGELNIAASNNPFGSKKQAYRQSAIRLTQELATMTHFKFKQIDQRSKSFAELAVTLWPRP